MNKPVTLLFSLAVYMIWISPVGKLILIWVQSSTLLIPRKPLTNWNVCAAMFCAVWSGRSIAFKNIFFKMHATLMSCVQLSERDTSKRLPVSRIDNWLAEYQIKRSSCFSWHCHIAYIRNNTWCKINSLNEICLHMCMRYIKINSSLHLFSNRCRPTDRPRDSGVKSGLTKSKVYLPVWRSLFTSGVHL